MKFVERKASTAKSKHTPEDFAVMKQAFLDDVVAVATIEDITPELTGAKLAFIWFQHQRRQWIEKGTNMLKSLGLMITTQSHSLLWKPHR